MNLNLLKINKKIGSLLLIVMTFSFANAANITSTGSGNWNSTVVNAPWPGGVVPSATDNVTIAAGHTVTLTGNASITNVTINSGATLNIANRTLTVNGFFTNNGTLTGTSGQFNAIGAVVNSGIITLTTGRVTTSGGNFTNTGTISLTSGRLSASGNFSSTGSLTYTAAGFLVFGGNFTYSGTFTLGSANVQFTGAANQSIQGFTTTGTVSMLKTGGTAIPTSIINGGGLTINGGGTLNLVSGTYTFSGNWTRTNGTLNCGSALLRIGRDILGTGSVFDAGTGTVEYYRAGNQAGAAVIYNNLILSGSGTKTFATTPTVNGKLTLAGTAAVTVTTGVVSYGPSATLQYETTNIRNTSSEEWVSPFTSSGGIVINSTNFVTLNADKVLGLSIPLTITSIGKLAAAARSLTFGGNFINSGGTFTSAGPIVIANTMTTQSIAGFTTTGLVSMTKTSGTATFGGNVGGAGLTINGAGGILNLGTSLTHTFTGPVALTSGTLNGNFSTLNVNFTGSAWTGTGSNFVAGSSTVKFGGAAQTLATATIFNNLTFAGTGTKTLTGVPTVNGILSMEGTATVSAAPTYGTSAALQYNRTTAQASGPEWITPFVASGGVSIIGTGVVTANAIKSFNATATLNIGSGATLANGGFAISGSSTLNVVNTGTLLLSGSSVFPVFTTITLGTNSNVNYNGTAQTVAVQNYGNLLLSGSGNKTFVGATTIAGVLAISSTAVAILLNGTTSSSGSLSYNGVLQTVSGSYGGTGSAAINANATWFGTSTTGILNVITACISGTWLGITSTDWNTPSNWCGGTVPTTLSDVTIGFTSNQPVIGASGGVCRNITILTGATLTISGSNTLTVRGSWTNNGNFVSNTSSVIFNGTSPQSIGGTSTTIFNDLSNTNITALVTANNDITVKNSLNISGASVFNLGTFVLTDGGSFSNAGSGSLLITNTSSTPIPTGKTWNSTVVYASATGGQTVVAGTYNGSPSIELENISGTQTASGNITTGGQLNIDNGGTPTFDMNGYNLSANALNLLSADAIIDMREGTLSYSTVPAMDGKIRFSGSTNGMPFESGTVEYYGPLQTVTAGNYYNLLFNGIGGVYTMSSDIDVANTLTVTNGAVTLQPLFNLTVGDAVTVVSPGTLTIEDSANLLQTTYTGPNTGNVIVKRNTTPVLQYDATFWSSPTTGTQTLGEFSPGTDWDRYNTYDSVNDVYVNEDATTAVFQKGIGYSIRCPDGTSSTVPTVIPHQFVGVPNNGDFTIPLYTPSGDIGLSLIGNPYPSALNAEEFIAENLYDAVLNPTNTLTGTYYIWSHNNRLTGNDFSSDDYYTCNLSGGVGYATSGTGNNNLPTKYIASGQGFFVENEIAGDLKFKNSMREKNTPAQDPKENANFYRTKNVKKISELERHRIWLDITDSAKTTGNQAMVGYIENATNDYDLGFDTYLFDDTKPLLIYSMLSTYPVAIQGRALPFSDTDTVPMGYYTKIADNVTISINSVDGLFLDDQGVFLEDKLLNLIHDLKSDPYVFASAAGTFNDRFVLRYTDGTLGTNNFNTKESTVLVSIKNKQIKINSTSETIDKIMVYDILGKQIYKKEKVSNQEVIISNLTAKNQLLIVKTTLQNGKTVSDKIVF
nr:T9SS sorting signal type C domain-containing protein [uncultured Flavobacterium sp.]